MEIVSVFRLRLQKGKACCVLVFRKRKFVGSHKGLILMKKCFKQATPRAPGDAWGDPLDGKEATAGKPKCAL